MLAARLHVPTRELRLEDVPTPEPGPGQVRIKVEAAGVCLSDVHLLDGTLSPLYLEGDTVTLGHETAGTVDAVGDGVTLFAVGQRVLLQAGELHKDGRILTRGVDYDGGWAEYALATETTLVAIPDALPFDQACIIPDAVSTPYAAVTVTGAVRPGSAVGVWGVGGLGAHGVQLLRLVGAAPVIALDPLPEARERALAFGADVALDPLAPDTQAKVQQLTGGLGLSAAFDFAGVPAVREQALGLLGRSGKLVLVGLSGQSLTIGYDTLFSYLQQQVLGHYGSEPQHVVELVELARHGRLDLSASISGVLPLAEAAAAVERLETKQGSPIRLVLRP